MFRLLTSNYERSCQLPALPNTGLYTYLANDDIGTLNVAGAITHIKPGNQTDVGMNPDHDGS